MRFVTFTRAAGTDQHIHLDADRCIAVVQCHVCPDLAEIHMEGGAEFMVKGSIKAVRETLWGSAHEETVPFGPKSV